MNTLLKPFAMRDLRLGRKFLLAVLLLVFAALYAIWVVYELTTSGIEFARRERLGLELHADLRAMQKDLQAYRGGSNALRSGLDGTRAATEQARAGVDAAVARIDAFHGRAGDPFDSAPAWRSLRNAWQALSRPPSGTAGGAGDTPPLEAHNTVLDDLLDLMDRVVRESNLILDPSRETYLIVEPLIAQEPRATADFGQARSLGLLLMSGQAGASGRERLAELLILSRVRADSIRSVLVDAAMAAPQIGRELEVSIARQVAADGAFFAAAERIRRDPAGSGVDPAEYFAAGAAATAARYELYRAGANAVDLLLRERERALSDKRAATLAGVSLALLVSAGLMLVILLDMNGRLRRAARAAERLADGRLQDAVPVQGRDEVGTLMQSMANAAAQLKAFSDAEIEIAQQQALGNTAYRIDVGQFPGAFGEIADKLNRLVSDHLAEQAQIIEAVQGYLRGDFSREPPALPGDKAQITRALEEVRRFLAIIYDAPVPVALLETGTRRYVQVNAAWLRQNGYPREQAIGRTSDEIGLISIEQMAAARAAFDAAQGGFNGYEMELKRHDGSKGVSLLWSQSVSLIDTRLEVFWQVDITDRRRAQRQLEEHNLILERLVSERTAALTQANAELKQTLDTLNAAQKDLISAEKHAALGRMVAGVAHELNTPIGNSLLVSSTLDDGVEKFAAQAAAGLTRSALDAHLLLLRQAAQMLSKNLGQAAQLIASFKQVAADQDSAQRRAFDLDEMLQELLATQQPQLRKRKVAVDTRVAPGLRMDSYPGPLGQVLTNLVTNAVQHGYEGREGGRVSVSAQPLGEDGLRIEVRDEGLGMPGDVLKFVFDPFYTTKLGRGGTGLGLTICQTIVSQVLGGKIQIDSRPGAGTTVTLDLPRTAPRAPAAAAAQA
jgi:PAS domain S-box-containing protein